ncbi:MAG: rRNA maturation RNase YbeY [Bacteroidales bacterium]|nr:rRNA maturation RNase YbeY [Bacteroidales bacterium]
MISYFTEDISFKFKGRLACKSWIKEVINNLEFNNRGLIPGDINIIFCNDDFLLKLNNQYLKHNHYTDVITFDSSDNKRINGDVFISIDSVNYNSKEYKCEFIDELHRVIIHGVLHLMGYNDSNDCQRAQMREREDEALRMRKF